MAGLRERLVFDHETGTVRDGPRRYLLMRPDVLMGMLARLDPAARAVAMQAFAEAAERHGGDSLSAYFASLGGDAAALLDATAAVAADLGWGRWTFSRDRDELHLVVDHSPFAHGHAAAVAALRGTAELPLPEAPVCAPIRGLLAAAASLVIGVGARVDERACAAAGHARCEFVAQRSDAPD
jgi:hypothetical protein